MQCVIPNWILEQKKNKLFLKIRVFSHKINFLFFTIKDVDREIGEIWQTCSLDISSDHLLLWIIVTVVMKEYLFFFLREYIPKILRIKSHRVSHSLAGGWKNSVYKDVFKETIGQMAKMLNLGNLDEGYTGILYIISAIFLSLFQSKEN